MASRDTAPNKTNQGGEEENRGGPSRGRTQVTNASTNQQGTSNRSEARSVSRGRTHAKLPPRDRRGRDDAFTEGFVYPGLGGTFVPKDRRATISEGAYLSDAPHLNYTPPYHPHQKKRRTSGAVSSPSHIRVEIEAMAEAAAAREEAARRAKAAEEREENLKE